ncbi:uncharacterized protein LOC128040413 [Gossypium raimondii]|uniref:uncharacterized protein LOC128040413 n=1 Tax=Gossypium raimondii TaxID=29730 RepID=UPI00227A887E|nr:uncharacterized protein LOC128040413 [Gossypium raimondii]
MSGSEVSGSDTSESDVSNRIRVNLDALNMDAIKVDELCDSDDSGRLDSAHKYDSDGQNWPEFNLENDMSNPKLKAGMLFKSKDSLKEAAKQYVRLNPTDPTDQTWQIRSSNPNHTCSKVYKNRNVTSAWIGEHYKEKFIVDPDYSLKSLQQDVKRDLCCIVSLTKCRRAKLRALELIEGAHKAQYEKIYEYFLESCKDGYRANCRRIVGLDRCFLKGYYGGYLLTAVGIDANNGIYPLAYAAVESENQALVLGVACNRLGNCELVPDIVHMVLEAKGKLILNMIKTIRTKIMLLIVKNKEEGDKWKGMLCPKIKKKLDVNIKDSLRCVPSHAGGDKYQVECGPRSQHVVDLVENSCSAGIGISLASLVKRHKVGVPTQQQATPNQQESTPTQQAAPTQLQIAPTLQ